MSEINRRGFLGSMCGAAAAVAVGGVAMSESVPVPDGITIMWNHRSTLRLTPAQRKLLMLEIRRLYAGAIKYRGQMLLDSPFPNVRQMSRDRIMS